MFKSILLAVDLADTQTHAALIEATLPIVERGKAALHVVTVLPEFGLSMVGGYFRRDFEKDALHQIGAALTAWVNANIPGGVNVHPHVLHGAVYDQIITAAAKLRADLIVIGAHRPDLSDYLLGPNAARVVRHATSSVFVVRS